MFRIDNILKASAIWLLFILLIVFSVNKCEGAEIKHCDTSLVLAVDTSGSVTQEEFILQRDGIAASFVNERVMKAIKGGPQHCVNIAMFYWSSLGQQEDVIPWRVLSSIEDCIQIATEISKSERHFYGSTGLGSAMKYGIALINSSNVLSDHLVIDISGDGQDNNQMTEPDIQKSIAENFGITINGLPIINDEKDVVEWYINHVKTSDGFVIQAKSFEEFGQAMINKLVQELM